MQHVGLGVVEPVDDPLERERDRQRLRRARPSTAHVIPTWALACVGSVGRDDADEQARPLPQRGAGERGDAQELRHVGGPAGLVVHEQAGAAARAARAQHPELAAIGLVGMGTGEVRAQRVAPQPRSHAISSKRSIRVALSSVGSDARSTEPRGAGGVRR